MVLLNLKIQRGQNTAKIITANVMNEMSLFAQAGSGH